MPHPEALTLSATRVLARLAHRWWCDRMLAAGWRPGHEYNPEAKTHDALVPFRRLDATDRWTAQMSVVCSGVLEILSRLSDYPRGSERILRPSDLRVGMSVAMSDVEFPVDVGTVLGWDTDGDRLSRILVRWPDGERTTHHPEERELRPLE